jgi:hypothetical protein
MTWGKNTKPYLKKITKPNEDCSVVQVAEHLSSKHKALNSITHTHTHTHTDTHTHKERWELWSRHTQEEQPSLSHLEFNCHCSLHGSLVGSHSAASYGGWMGQLTLAVQVYATNTLLQLPVKSQDSTNLWWCRTLPWSGSYSEAPGLPRRGRVSNSWHSTEEVEMPRLLAK